jgi:hypothetical protein
MSLYDTAKKAERLIAKRYEELGYTVTTEPSLSAIPFDLKGYKPDLLAVKAGEKLLIDVKGPRGRIDQDLYLRVGQEVQQHPGWKFLLATVSADELIGSVAVTAPVATLGSIKDRLEKLDQLLATADVASIVFPTLWNVYAMALRLLLREDGNTLEGLTDLSIVNRAYTDGVLSNSEYEDSKRFLQLRNAAAHTVDEVTTKADCDALRRLVDKLLTRLV